MKINLSDRLIAWLALLSGLSISAVAIYYSVAGLVAIFAAAVIPIIVMGVALESGKLAATVWLKQNWSIAPGYLKTYLLIAIIVLMMITSMGIFGYLSKAHLDQAVPTSDIADKVSLIDEKIKTERENIDASRKALKQLDESVDQVMARSTNEQGANRAAQLRRTQAKERTQLQADIAKSQSAITKLNDERSPIAKELRKVEAEVGPIKYIAALIYGENTDANLLESAVRWIIIVIVLVFDPLAVILLLASQYSFSHFRKQSEEHEKKSINDFVPQPQTLVVDEPVVKTEPSISLPESVEPAVKEPEVVINEQTHPYLYKTGGGFKDLKPMVYTPDPVIEEDDELDDADEIDHPDDSIEIRQAKKDWKHDHPNDSLKRQKKMFERGLITQLPWEKYLKAQADYTNNDAALEAARWAQEQIESADDSKKKVSDMVRESGRSTDKKEPTGIEGYIQNAEQNPSTIWQRVKKAKGE
jgi:hypothetical protein